MNAVIRFELGLYKYELRVSIEKKESPSPHRTIDFEEIHEYEELSIVGATWERSTLKGRWNEASGGQCIGEFRDLVRRIDDPRRPAGTNHPLVAHRDALNELCDIWERWHLNGMNAACREQKVALAGVEFERDLHGSTFDSICATLSARQLQPFPIPPGRDCGGRNTYRYGAAWLVEVLPDEVKDRIGALVTTLGGISSAA